MIQNKKKLDHKTDDGVFNLEELGDMINQTPNATPMNTYADDED